jgi:tetratricopeptide (TPR) repeat protein
LESDVLSNLGFAANALQQHEQAKEYLTSTLALARSTGDRYAEKLALDRLAVAVLNLGDRPEALRLLERARALAAAVRDPKHEAELYWSSAILHSDLGQLARAVQCGQTAIEIMRKFGHPAADWYADHITKYQSHETSATLTSPEKHDSIFGGAIDASAITAQPRATSKTSGPGLLRMAVTATKAMATFVGSGFKTTPQDTYKSRLTVCETCEHHTGRRCRICGCITMAKAKLLHEQCPAGRW